MLRVNNLKLAQVFYTFHPCLLHVGYVVVGIAEVFEHLFMACFMLLIFLFEVVEDISYTKSCT